MAENPHDGLAYGHYGECIYDTASQTWNWSRSFKDPVSWISLGRPTEIEYHPSPDSQTIGARRSQASGTSLQPVIQSQPETVPALDDLRRFLGYNPAAQSPKSDRLRSQESEGVKLLITKLPLGTTAKPLSIECCCFVTDSSAQILHIVPLPEQKQGWAGDRRTCLRVPCPSDDHITWKAPSKILQIVASHSIDHNRQQQLLAARTADYIFVLRPLLSSRPGAARASNNALRPICKVLYAVPNLSSIETTTDLAFNPWYHWQLGTVESDGTWRIHDLPHSHLDLEVNRQPYQACRGTMKTTDSFRPLLGAELRADPWSRLFWVGSPSIFVVCNRIAAILVDISGKIISRSLPDPGLSKTGCIVDACRDPNSSDCILILTSSHLVRFRVHIRDPNSYDTSSREIIVQLVFKLNHYRDHLDLDMRLTIPRMVEEHNTLTTIAITSMATTLTTVFEVQNEPGSSQEHLLTLLDPSFMSCTWGARFACMQPIRWTQPDGDNLRGAEASLGEFLHSNDCTFFIVTFLSSKGEVYQQLVCRVPADRLDTVKPQLIAPQWRSRLPTERLLPRDTFVVSDELGSDDEVNALDIEGVSLDSRIVEDTRKIPCVDLRQLYVTLNQMYTDERVEYGDVMDGLRAATQSASETKVGKLKLLSDLADGHVIITDLRADTLALPDIMHSLDAAEEEEHDQVRMNISQIESRMRSGISGDNENEVDLTSLYDHMVSRWVAPLNDHIPGRVRLAKEQLSRSIAAQVYLASFKVQSQKYEETRDDGRGSTPRSETMSSTIGANTSPTSSRMPSPSPESQPRVDPLQSAMEELKHFVVFDEPQEAIPSLHDLPTGPGMPGSLAKILDQWEVGADPAEYDWASVRSQNEESGTSSLSEFQRQRQSRRARRHEERRARESTAASSQSRATSVAPSIAISSSQPAPLEPGIRPRARSRAGFSRDDRVQTRSQTQTLSQGYSSQSQDYPQGVASQIEPGRHGGRLVVELPMMRRKKRRLEGF